MRAQEGSSKDAPIAALRPAPNGSRAGFTLIELLIVVVIIGILAAIAIPKFAATKGAAHVSSMKSDLRNLVVAEEAYATDNGGAYYGGAIPNAALVYNPSSGVAITLAGVSVSGWGATATHPSTTRVCAIYSGTGGPIGPATVEGKIACTP